MRLVHTTPSPMAPYVQPISRPGNHDIRFTPENDAATPIQMELVLAPPLYFGMHDNRTLTTQAHKVQSFRDGAEGWSDQTSSPRAGQRCGATHQE